MSEVDFVDDIDPKSFVKNTKKAVVLNIDYYNELKRKADFVDKMISPNANEIYKELNELKAKVDKLDEKETPYKPKGIEPIGMSKIGFCKCSGEVLLDENYCSNCGQKLDWSESEGE